MNCRNTTCADYQGEGNCRLLRCGDTCKLAQMYEGTKGNNSTIVEAMYEEILQGIKLEMLIFAADFSVTEFNAGKTAIANVVLKMIAAGERRLNGGKINQTKQEG